TRWLVDSLRAPLSEFAIPGVEGEPAVNTVRELLFPGLVVVVTALVGVWLSAESQATQQASSSAPGESIAGTWTLNKDLSDQPPADQPSDEGRIRRRGGYWRGGGMGGGYGR